MKILKIIHGYPPLYNAGSEVYSQSICNELSKEHNVFIFTREENPYEKDFQLRTSKLNDKLTIHLINKRIDKDNYKNKNIDHKFSSILKEIKPNVAHIGHLNHLSTGIVNELNKQNIPIVFTLHDFWLMCPRGQFLQRNFENEQFYTICNKQEHKKCALNCYNHYFSGQDEDSFRDEEYWTSWIETRMKETKSIIEKVDLFLAPSKYLMNRFIDEFKVPVSKIKYLDYGFPNHYLQPVSPQKTDTFTFGYIGTHIPAKGINLLIKAFSKINKNAILKIWGRTSGQSTAALKIEASKSQNKIQFCGEYINQNIATEVFSNIDCIVVPSIWGENSPLVIHEAQACKIPVITSNFGGMKEYVEHKKNGLLFEHRNENDLREKMNFAIDNPLLLKKWGNRGYLLDKKGVVPHIKDHCAELTKVYKKTIENRKKNG
jgi:glycosyltransferase involved in cell wall biosynthesis